VTPGTRRIVSVVGNPRPESRTHNLARTLASALALELDTTAISEIDLAQLGASVLDPADPAAAAAVQEVLDADVLIIASPTFKATYSGLLKTFLDRFGAGSLSGVPAALIMLGGAPNHQLAVDVHLAPLLLELGASVPTRGLFVLESELDQFDEQADSWAHAHARLFGRVNEDGP
jgi:FMN reductase